MVLNFLGGSLRDNHFSIEVLHKVQIGSEVARLVQLGPSEGKDCGSHLQQRYIISMYARETWTALRKEAVGRGPWCTIGKREGRVGNSLSISCELYKVTSDALKQCAFACDIVC